MIYQVGFLILGENAAYYQWTVVYLGKHLLFHFSLRNNFFFGGGRIFFPLL